jgi:hypothetical protein
MSQIRKLASQANDERIAILLSGIASGSEGGSREGGTVYPWRPAAGAAPADDLFIQLPRPRGYDPMSRARSRSGLSKAKKEGGILSIGSTLVNGEERRRWRDSTGTLLRKVSGSRPDCAPTSLACAARTT